ncbi:MAG: single-stranded DNA-binding protein [Bacteroidales bacterium]|nr:single-stranded DNA-binding protein [Bacteroidales bacterium]
MLNKIMLIGRTGKDPVLHTTKSEKKVVTFTLATWENFKDEKEESGWRTETEWFNIVVWGDSAEPLSKKVKKGDLVLVEGKVRTRSYEDKEGTTKYITEVIGFARAINPSKKSEVPVPEEKAEPKKSKQKDEVPEKVLDDLDEIINSGDAPF